MDTILDIGFTLTIVLTEERRGDEPRLEFAFVQGSSRGTIIDARSTGESLGESLGRGSVATGLFHVTKLATGGVTPFFGIAVRAIERDSSRDSDRNRDFLAWQTGLRAGLDGFFARPLVPSTALIRRLTAAAPVTDNAGDDDDAIGVGVLTFPSLGNALDVPPGSLINSSRLRFPGRSAAWTLDIAIRIPDELI